VPVFTQEYKFLKRHDSTLLQTAYIIEEIRTLRVRIFNAVLYYIKKPLGKPVNSSTPQEVIQRIGRSSTGDYNLKLPLKYTQRTEEIRTLQVRISYTLFSKLRGGNGYGKGEAVRFKHNFNHAP
jgi:hypothetical protein